MQTFAYVVLEVGGIQKYILSTGKLKEMIGGSEIIASLGERCHEICHKELGLDNKQEPISQSQDWYCMLQESGGTIRLLMPTAEQGKAFLTAISAYAVEFYAGLPLYGTQVQCAWTVESLGQARKEAGERIAQKRNASTLAPKGLWPFCRSAPLDGLPVVATDKDECISAPSKARRAENLLQQAKKRLQGIVPEERLAVPPDTYVEWVADMDELLQGSRVQRIALIHIDGNSLGVAFHKRLTKAHEPTAWIQSLKELSHLVDSANKEAFAKAVEVVVAKDCEKSTLQRKYIVPLRPLVLGGDDLTVIVRADLAFDFITAYTHAFESISKEKGEALTVGGGMVIMQKGYPFARAFHLVEQLTDSAKRMTSSREPRLSSLDYLILTNDVTPDLAEHREHIARAEDGHSLTAKPFYCGQLHGESIEEKQAFHMNQVLKDANLVLKHLPASHTREAISQCRKGQGHAQQAWAKLRENIQRGIGGRNNKDILRIESFDRLFPQNFYRHKGAEKTLCTLLGDYIELRSLDIFQDVTCKEAG